MDNPMQGLSKSVTNTFSPTSLMDFFAKMDPAQLLPILQSLGIGGPSTTPTPALPQVTPPPIPSKQAVDTAIGADRGGMIPAGPSIDPGMAIMQDPEEALMQKWRNRSFYSNNQRPSLRDLITGGR